MVLVVKTRAIFFIHGILTFIIKITIYATIAISIKYPPILLGGYYLQTKTKEKSKYPFLPS